MPIVSSVYITDEHTQVGGGRWTLEKYTDDAGHVYTVGPYLWDGVSDRDAVLAARAASLNERLIEEAAR